MSNSNLLGFVETYEDIYRQKASLQLREKGLDQEAKSIGFDPPTIKRVVRARLKSAEQILKEQAAKAEKEALFEIYCASLGMLDGTPLGDAARERMAKDFKEKPQPKPKKGKGGGAAAGQQPERDDDEAAAPEPPPKSIGSAEIEEARAAGADAHKAGVSVLKNPYVAGDPRRASWDEGWCAEAGSDGMEIPAAYRRTKKKPDGDELEPGNDDAPAPGAAR
ncbi:MAG: DUF2312 domain-containing protein [Hyphomonadaceae bacterium]|nr:DUF2312 domain-containing protein [Hyphomonadaceae bacterium]